jgi:hypothetical protein
MWHNYTVIAMRHSNPIETLPILPHHNPMCQYDVFADHVDWLLHIHQMHRTAVGYRILQSLASIIRQRKPMIHT